MLVKTRKKNVKQKRIKNDNNNKKSDKKKENLTISLVISCKFFLRMECPKSQIDHIIRGKQYKSS